MQKPIDLRTLSEFAERLADAGAAASMRHFRRRTLVSENKAGEDGFDPVTVADRETEAAMRDLITRERPLDAVFGEEQPPTAGSSGLTWVLDPIDGTRSFISGLPTWGVLVALDDGETERVGVIEQPHIGERFLGICCPEQGNTAWLAHRGTREAIRCRPCPGLSGATLFTTAPEIFTEPERAGFTAVSERVRLTRYGVDCYAYALLAMGQIDLVVEAGLARYDIAAPAALIRAAGGIVTDWQGGDCRSGGRALAAGDPRTHAAALEILSRVA